PRREPTVLGPFDGVEHGFWTLGRQTLLDPVEWAEDGWFAARGGDLSRPISLATSGGAHGQALSDDFKSDKFGTQWSFYDPGSNETARATRKGGVLAVKAKGTAPKDSSPLTFIV